jgi:two-component system, LytTR family, sensor kinase
MLSLKTHIQNIILSIKKNKRAIMIHFGAWVLYLLINDTLLFIDSPNGERIYRTFFTYPLLAALFYANAYGILDRFAPKKQYFKIFIDTILLGLCYTILRYLLMSKLLAFLNISSGYVMFANNFWVDSIWLVMQYLFFSYGYWFAIYNVRLEKQKRILQSEYLLLEKEKVIAEMAFLNAQINPHFLYNTLNFMYSKAIFVSDELSDSIMTLSNIMRYTISEAQQDGLIKVQKELSYINDYIKLQQYRFDNEVQINIETEGEEYYSQTYIIYLVIISFVENAFKHGDLFDSKNPLTIKVCADEETFSFSVLNKKSAGPKEISSGVGMANIEKRLQLKYKEKYKLEINDEKDIYFVKLTLLETNFN